VARITNRRVASDQLKGGKSKELRENRTVWGKFLQPSLGIFPGPSPTLQILISWHTAHGAAVAEKNILYIFKGQGQRVGNQKNCRQRHKSCGQQQKQQRLTTSNRNVTKKYKHKKREIK